MKECFIIKQKNSLINNFKIYSKDNTEIIEINLKLANCNFEKFLRFKTLVQIGLSEFNNLPKEKLDNNELLKRFNEKKIITTDLDEFHTERLREKLLHSKNQIISTRSISKVHSPRKKSTENYKLLLSYDKHIFLIYENKLNYEESRKESDWSNFIHSTKIINLKTKNLLILKSEKKKEVYTSFDNYYGFLFYNISEDFNFGFHSFNTFSISETLFGQFIILIDLKIKEAQDFIQAVNIENHFPFFEKRVFKIISKSLDAEVKITGKELLYFLKDQITNSNILAKEKVIADISEKIENQVFYQQLEK